MQQYDLMNERQQKQHKKHRDRQFSKSFAFHLIGFSWFEHIDQFFNYEKKKLSNGGEFDRIKERLNYMEKQKNRKVIKISTHPQVVKYLYDDLDFQKFLFFVKNRIDAPPSVWTDVKGGFQFIQQQKRATYNFWSNLQSMKLWPGDSEQLLSKVDEFIR